MLVCATIDLPLLRQALSFVCCAHDHVTVDHSLLEFGVISHAFSDV